LIMPQFDIEEWCRLVQDHRITYAYVVPPMLLLLSKHPRVGDYDLSSIRMVTSGAAPLSRDLVTATFKRTGIRVKQGYGLSETSPTAFYQRWEDWDTAIGSTGLLLPNMEAKFCEVSETGETEGWETRPELPRGETGELYVKGPNIFLGYHNKPEATKECLSADGWFRTGDVGHVDDDGNLFITDRAKELFKYKGFQVPPAELEGYLVDHELVNDVAVVGVEAPALGTEVPRAYIVRKGGVAAVEPGDDQTIMAWLAQKVANHKKLRGGVRFVDAVPKSASGKILRRVLKEEAKKEVKELETLRARL
jgi:4-coumarate--CoA ligase